MNPILLSLIGLRSSALALSLAGQTKTSDALYLIADALAAGTLVDEHLAAVAVKLKERDLTEEDWDDLTNRIEAGSERLQAVRPGVTP